MALKIEQDCEYKDQEWWEWCVWVEAAEEELDEIK